MAVTIKGPISYEQAGKLVGKTATLLIDNAYVTGKIVKVYDDSEDRLHVHMVEAQSVMKLDAVLYAEVLDAQT